MKTDLTKEIILEKVSKKMAGMSFTDAWHKVGGTLMHQIVNAAMEEYRNQPSPDNTARTAEGACNEYIEHLRISSASLDPTRDMNRRKGFMAGYKAASQFKSQSCVDSVNNIIPAGKYNNSGEFVLLGAKQDSKEVEKSFIGDGKFCTHCGRIKSHCIC